ILKLGVAIRMRRAFLDLAVGLQAVAQLLQQVRNHAVCYGMVLPLKFLRQLACALTRPAQGRFWVPSGNRIDQSIQSLQQSGIDLRQGLAPTPDTSQADTNGFARMCLAMLKFTDTSRYGISGETCSIRDSCDAAPTERDGFSGSPLSTHALVHYWRKREILLPYPFDCCSVLHARTIADQPTSYNTNLLKLFFRGSLRGKLECHEVKLQVLSSVALCGIPV